MNNHAARVERIARIRPADLSQPPTSEEIDAEKAKMEADPTYDLPWSETLLQSWLAQIKREVEEGRNAP